jgi:hypothetical protein
MAITLPLSRRVVILRNDYNYRKLSDHEQHGKKIQLKCLFYAMKIVMIVPA